MASREEEQEPSAPMLDERVISTLEEGGNPAYPKLALKLKKSWYGSSVKTGMIRLQRSNLDVVAAKGDQGGIPPRCSANV